MNRGEVMQRVKFLRHKDKMLLNFDFSGLDIEAARKVCAYGKDMVSRVPKGTLLTLVNVSNVKYDDDFKSLAEDLALHNKPYVLAGAVLGVDKWRKVLFWATSKLTGRTNLKMFDDEEQAKDWLASYTNR